MTRPCKYGCGTELGAFDEENRKYLEAASGGLHTKERCQEAKAKLQTKNDHGNEIVESPKQMYQRLADIPKTEYVDHTLKPELVLKTLTDPTPEGIDLKYNNFAKEHKIRYSQSHVLGSQYTVYVWYEEK